VLADLLLKLVFVHTVFSQTANITNATTHAPLSTATITAATTTTSIPGNCCC